LARSRLSELDVRSPGAGTFEMGEVQNMAGRFVQRGELLAYITNEARTTIRVVVPQADADQVRKGSIDVLVRFVDSPGTVRGAKVMRSVPAATNQLPGMALSLQGGGKIGVDPTKQGEAKALENLFVLDLQLVEDVAMDKLGSRVYVRFEHTPEPLGNQWFRAGRNIFMKKFNV
jgi:putative peptide zinc metalloprotease protein